MLNKNLAGRSCDRSEGSMCVCVWVVGGVYLALLFMLCFLSPIHASLFRHMAFGILMA